MSHNKKALQNITERNINTAMTTSAFRAELQKAVDFFSGQAALATALGKRNQAAIANWFRRGSVPPADARQMQFLTDGEVRAHILCPEEYSPYDILLDRPDSDSEAAA